MSPRTSSLVVTFSLAITTPAWSQQAQTGQAPTAPTTAQSARTTAGESTGTTSTTDTTFRPGTSSAAGAAMPGQSGTFSDFGPAAPRQGQFTPSGRPVQGPAMGPITSQRFVPFGGVPLGGVTTFEGVPTFFQPGVARPGFTHNEFNQFNMGVAEGETEGGPPSGAQAHTVRRIPTPRATLQPSLGGLVSTIADAPASRRYRQLEWQALGYGPLTDPIVQRELNLTPQQQQDVQLLANRWNQKIRMLELNAGPNAPLSDRDFNQLRRESRKQINSLLTVDQQHQWPQLIGPHSTVEVASDNIIDSLQQDDYTPFR